MTAPTEGLKAAAKVATSALQFTPRRSAARGNADHGWLKSYHTFSFANYQDTKFDQFGSLRVINEDRVEPGTGFGLHSHREFEIWSYIVSGELEHKDSMGNLEIMKRGDVQMTSTGTGISHSEYNRNKKSPVHFLQIWGLPSKSRLPPTYYNRHFTDEEKRDKLVRVVGEANTEGVNPKRNGDGPAPVHSHINMFATIHSPSSTLTHSLAPSTTKAYLHNIMTSGYRAPHVTASDKFETGGAMLKVNGGLVLEEGDGAFVEVAKDGDRTLTVQNVGDVDSEWVLFEIA